MWEGERANQGQRMKCKLVTQRHQLAWMGASKGWEVHSLEQRILSLYGATSTFFLWWLFKFSFLIFSSPEKQTAVLLKNEIRWTLSHQGTGRKLGCMLLSKGSQYEKAVGCRVPATRRCGKVEKSVVARGWGQGGRNVVVQRTPRQSLFGVTL